MPMVNGEPPSERQSEQARAFAATAIHSYHEDLHRFLRRRVWHAQDLDDVVQEVYLRLLRVKNSEMVRNPLEYLYGVASHVVREFNLGKHHTRMVFDSDAVDTMMDNPGPSSSVDAGGHFERQVSEALGQLPPNRMAVLLLERRDGLSQAEIAQKLGLSVHTVKKYSVEALAHVRASLER
ncbi:MAG: RNA polymerase sigma factor [Rhodanobacter sp.]